MFRTMRKSEIRRLRVTETGPFGGGILVDAELLDAADLLEGEQVAIVDETGGVRSRTYVLAGRRGSGVIGLCDQYGTDSSGDQISLIAYGVLDELEARNFQPRVVIVDAANRPTGDSAHAAETGAEVPDVTHPNYPATGGTDSNPHASVETADAARLDALLHQPEN